MRFHKFTFLLPILLFACCLHAQRYGDRDSYNKLGIQVGVTHGSIDSENFTTTKTTGFMGGLTTRSNIYNNFLLIYGVNFYSMSTGIMGHPVNNDLLTNIEFKTTGVQLNLFAGHKIIKENLSIEAGPILQINSKWEVDNQYKEYLVEDYNISAQDLEEVNRINLNVAGNISMGFRDAKLWLQYQYGVSNFLNALNDSGLKEKDSRAANLEGHLGMATAGVVYYF